MLPLLELTSIAEKWRLAIRGSAEIEDFCQLKYGKSLKIYKGFDKKNPPKETDCPYCILMPGTKSEGAGKPEYNYMISIAWCILNKTPIITETDVEYPGVTETDKLGNLIWQAIAEINPSYPVTDIDYDIEPNEFYPQYPGSMHLVLTIPRTMGSQLVY